MTKPIPTDEDLHAKIAGRWAVDPASGCWNWTGATHRATGRGLVSFHQEPFYAYRVAYTALVGPIPEGMLVCHRCDNPTCVNPDHLFLGRNEDNLRDMWAKGRGVTTTRRGSSHGNAKLSDEDVVSMSTRYAQGGVTQNELAAEYGINRSAVSGIVRGATWRHIARPTVRRWVDA